MARICTPHSGHLHESTTTLEVYTVQLELYSLSLGESILCDRGSRMGRKFICRILDALGKGALLMNELIPIMKMEFCFVNLLKTERLIATLRRFAARK